MAWDSPMLGLLALGASHHPNRHLECLTLDIFP